MHGYSQGHSEESEEVGVTILKARPHSRLDLKSRPEVLPKKLCPEAHKACLDHNRATTSFALDKVTIERLLAWHRTQVSPQGPSS